MWEPFYLTWLLKIYFKRERPEIHRILDANGFSFPSGHTMMAFSLYTIIAYIAWRNVKTTLNRILLILSAAFMSIMIPMSRIYLGVHFPSDCRWRHRSKCPVADNRHNRV